MCAKSGANVLPLADLELQEEAAQLGERKICAKPSLRRAGGRLSNRSFGGAAASRSESNQRRLELIMKEASQFWEAKRRTLACASPAT